MNVILDRTIHDASPAAARVRSSPKPLYAASGGPDALRRRERGLLLPTILSRPSCGRTRDARRLVHFRLVSDADEPNTLGVTMIHVRHTPHTETHEHGPGPSVTTGAAVPLPSAPLSALRDRRDHRDGGRGRLRPPQRRRSRRSVRPARRVSRSA